MDILTFIDVLGIVLELVGVLTLIGEFWVWLNQGKRIERPFPWLWEWWGNNKTQKWSILLIVLGVLFQIIAKSNR